jgi:hypothetical protein
MVVVVLIVGLLEQAVVAVQLAWVELELLQ